MKAVEKSKNTGLANVQEVCGCWRLNRDAYYKLNVLLPKNWTRG